MSELSIALTALSAAMTSGKAFVEARDTAKAQESLIEFNKSIIEAQSKIMEAQSAQAALAAKVDELEKECMRLKNWDAEKQQYTFAEIADGAFAYVENSGMDNFQSARKLCCNCFESGKKSILQQRLIPEGMKVGLSCHSGCPELVFFGYKN